MTKHSICSWSGGKDSCFALMQAINLGYNPRVLLNVLNEEGNNIPFAWDTLLYPAGTSQCGRVSSSLYQQFVAGL
jgi:diphthamide synthase (EF-2-diphthine--ammonia ligase)